MNKKNFIIGIDMDDTIENLLNTWTKCLNIKYGYSYTIQDVRDWDLHLTYSGLTEEQIYEPLLNDTMWEQVQPKPDAVKYIKMLVEEGFTVYICTHSDYRTLKTKMEKVLFKYFPYLSWNNVIVCKDKYMCKFDILVDDHWKNLVNGDYIGILYNTPYNESFNEYSYHRIYRKYNWCEIYETINCLYQERIDEEWMKKK